ncbi:hypothetical protein WJX72_008914 [[Myrmecia] bisecta]|uniref:Allophanate hydrolase C-terminal domain-containing protein n=1 Tax=[Myrmecia] bisecta TaxID=41462 RepID=A0AAW1P937_9CHLO
MVYVKAGGAAIELEVWEMPTEKFGYFMQYIKAPLGIGTVWLDDGSWVYGFICEGFVAQSGEGVEDVTHTGGWLNYLAGKEAQ